MKSKKEGLKLLRKERVVARVWNILCIDCDREKKTAFFGRAAGSLLLPGMHFIFLKVVCHIVCQLGASTASLLLLLQSRKSSEQAFPPLKKAAAPLSKFVEIFP